MDLTLTLLIIGLLVLGVAIILIISGSIIVSHVASSSTNPIIIPVSTTTNTFIPQATVQGQGQGQGASILPSSGCAGFNGPSLVCVYNATDLSFTNGGTLLYPHTYGSYNVPSLLIATGSTPNIFGSLEIEITIGNKVNINGWTINTTSNDLVYDAISDQNFYQNGDRSGVIIFKRIAGIMPILYNYGLNNSNLFLNELYQDYDIGKITTAINNEQFITYFTPQVDNLISIYSQYWINPGTSYYLPSSDKMIINLIKSYVLNYTPYMWVPNLSATIVQPSGKPVYTLNKYTLNDINTQLDLFFHLLLAGAHFVFVSAAPDLACIYQQQAGCVTVCNGGTTIPNFIDGVSLGTPVYNNYHYGMNGNYIAGTTDSILSTLLIGKTAGGNTYNSYIQLNSNNSYNNYVWNISPLGAAGYSEKRATTIFISVPGFDPNNYNVLKMNGYYGAYATSLLTPPSWLESDLAIINSGCGLPQRFIM